MLVSFFVIVFIAEIVVTFKIIEIIRMWDKRVCAVSEQIVSSNKKIQTAFTDLRVEINSILLKLNKAQIKIEEEKRKYTNKVLKYLISTALYLLLDNKGKKIFSTIELAISVAEYVKLYLKKIA